MWRFKRGRQANDDMEDMEDAPEPESMPESMESLQEGDMPAEDAPEE